MREAIEDGVIPEGQKSSKRYTFFFIVLPWRFFCSREGHTRSCRRQWPSLAS